MPFTLAHPAIVLPFQLLNRKYISLSALIIGSITPDFEYFLKMKLSGRYSHTVEGIFLMDLPVAILLCLIFHQWVKEPLIDNLPGYFKGRLQSLKQHNFLRYASAHYYGFIGCLLIGISSHVLWDSFTHPSETFMWRPEVLRQTYSVFGLPPLHLYNYLQHLSTLVGTIVIAWYFHKMPVTSGFESIAYKYWLVITLISIVGYAVRASFGFEYFGDIVVTIISSLCIGVTVASILPKPLYG
jgi:hypothetical protein